ncbi:hypothetical protein D3C71_1841670 [compost metagenome]
MFGSNPVDAQNIALETNIAAPLNTETGLSWVGQPRAIYLLRGRSQERLLKYGVESLFAIRGLKAEAVG